MESSVASIGSLVLRRGHSSKKLVMYVIRIAALVNLPRVDTKLVLDTAVI